eukprot:2816912-Prorocentrum_lima.AAC.1
MIEVTAQKRMERAPVQRPEKQYSWMNSTLVIQWSFIETPPTKRCQNGVDLQQSSTSRQPAPFTWNGKAMC